MTDIVHKTVSFYPCVAAFVNGERVTSAALFPCLRPDKNNQKFLVDFYYTDSNNNLKTVQFSNRDIKRCIPYQEMYGYHIVTKIAGENMHIAFVFMDLCRKPFAYGQTLKIKPKSFQGWLKEFDIPMDPNILIDGFGALGMPYRPIIGSSNAGIEMWLGFHLDPNLKIFENWKILEFDWKITEEENRKGDVFLFLDFLKSHKCYLSSCDGFSYLKCAQCKVAHYCNNVCQIQDWSNHMSECLSLRLQRKLNKTAMNQLQKNLVSQLPYPVMSFKKTIKKISFEIFKQNAKNTNSFQIVMSKDPSLAHFFKKNRFLNLLSK